MKSDNTFLYGLYADPSKNTYIDMTQDKIYISKVSPVQQQVRDTIAECVYRVLNNEFIEIKTSEDSYPYPYKNYEIEIDTISDECQIMIDVPNVSYPLSVELDTGDRLVNYVLDKNNNHSITVKYDQISDLSFFILPGDISLIPFKSDGINNGLVLFSQFIDNDSNDIYNFLYDYLYNHNYKAYIKIKIPNLTDATYTKMYIPGDYIRYKDKNLFWRGIVFEKKEE